MELHEEQRGDALIISPVGKMDAVTVTDFNHCFEARIEAGTTRFIIDMGRLNYISSAGLRGVLTAFKKTEARQGRFQLCGLHGPVREAFQLSGFLTHFKTFDNVEDALSEP